MPIPNFKTRTILNMKTLNENQMGLLRRLERFHWARPGDVTGSGYSHPIGANNGLKGLVSAGLANHNTRFAKRGIRSHGGACLTINVYQITDAGRALLHPVEVPAQPESPTT